MYLQHRTVLRRNYHVYSPAPDFLVMANFAQRLKELRTARKLTQTRLAELLAISPRVYSRWEHGGVTPHFGTIVRLADILGVSLDELAGRKDVSSETAIKNPEL